MSESENTARLTLKLGRIYATPCTFDQAIQAILNESKQRHGAIVVTPNIAHVEQARRSDGLVDAYDRALIAPCDGWPVVFLARWTLRISRHSVERVTGADLLPRLCEYAGLHRMSVGLVGGGDGASIKASAALESATPGIVCNLVEAAPAAELRDEDSRAALVKRIITADPDILFLGLGAPKQEEFALELLSLGSRAVILCVGAAIDFAAGQVPRAPRWARSSCLEWAFRIVREPRRLGLRYLRAGIYFGVVCLESIRTRKASTSRD